MATSLEDELERARSLERGGETAEALSAFDGVIVESRRSQTEDALRAGFKAAEAKCQMLCGRRQWSEALEACEEALALRVGEDFGFRWVLADVRWMTCLAMAQVSVERSGERGDTAHCALDSLVVWLREQPEPAFRPELARRLADRMRWHARQELGLDSLDELVSLLAEIADPALTRKLADVVIKQTPWLFFIGDDDWGRVETAVADALDSGSETLDPVDELGVSERSALRMERLADSLMQLETALVDDDDATAAELRAAVLINALTALQRLGRDDAAQYVGEQLAILGRATIAACDRISREAYENEANGYGDASATRASIALLKVGILVETGDTETAIFLLNETIETFGSRTDPLFSALIRVAREQREELVASIDADA